MHTKRGDWSTEIERVLLLDLCFTSKPPWLDIPLNYVLFQCMFFIKISWRFNIINPPGSKASKEVPNLTERKNPHTPECQRICLSVCLSVINFDPNYLRTGKTANFGEAGVLLLDSSSRWFANLCNLSRIVGEAKKDGSGAKYWTLKQISKWILNTIRPNIE